MSMLHKVGRSLSVMALAGALVVSGSSAAVADPDTINQARVELERLEQQQTEIDQQYVAVQEKRDQSQKALDAARADADVQAGKVAQLRAQVGQVALQQYRGRAYDTTTALLVTDDVDSFLSRLSTVQKINDNSNSLLQDYQSAQANLADTQRAAAAQLAQVSAEEQNLAALKKQSAEKVQAAERLLARLTEEQRK
ncbi:MAG: hypothetical protein Q4G45_11700, partial [Actinomycetia bacterium]|nr:hypothetical protein [Actinomycetes bacterium]